METATTKAEAGTGNKLQQFQAFLNDVRAESKKVSWPSRDEVRDATIAVIVTATLLAVFIFLVDQAMNVWIKAIL